MTHPDQSLEAAIVAAGANIAPRITPQDVEANIASEMIDLKKERNFFETRVIEYQSGGALSWGDEE